MAVVLVCVGLGIGGCAARIVEPAVQADVAERVDAIVAQLQNRETRDAARSTLRELGRPATPYLLRHLSDPDMTVRWETVSVLGTTVDDRALPALIDRALRDDNPHVRWRSLWALGRFEDEQTIVDGFLEELSATGTTRWNAAVGLSVFERPEAVPVLHANLAHPDSWRRWEAINALGRVHDERSASALAPLLSSEHVRDRNETVMSLGKIGGETAVELLLGALDDPAPSVRWRVCLALGRIGDPRAVPALQGLAKSETDSRVLEHAADALDRLR